MSALILLTGESRDYLPALVQMKIPYEIAFMVMAAVHFLPMLKEEAMDVYYSVQLRGTEIANAPLPKKLRAFSKICMPILVGAINRAKQMSIAMEARGFRSRPPPHLSSYHQAESQGCGAAGTAARSHRRLVHIYVNQAVK